MKPATTASALCILALLASLPAAAAAPARDSGGACEEVGYVASFRVLPGAEARFEAAVLELTEKVLAVEQGVRLYAPFRSDVGGLYYMMERYENAAARQAHATDPAVRALFPPLLELLSEPVDVVPVSAVCAGAR